MIVDCHTHWGDCFQARDGTNPAKWLATFDRYGVTHAVVLPFAGLLDAGKIRADNDAVAAVCAVSGGRMIQFCTVNSWFPEEAVAELRRCFGQLKFRGIKFHPWLQGQPVNSRGMDEICEIAAEHDAPILFHDGTPPYSLPSQMAVLARRHPRTQMILGHCGLLEHWREAAAAMSVAENLWGCICGPHVEGMKHLIQKCDSNRLLWGSDFGFNFKDSIDYRLHMMDVLGLSDSVREKIFADNPKRLLRINGEGGDA